MSSNNRTVRCAHVQFSIPEFGGILSDVKEKVISKHLSMIDSAGQQGVQILCLQELFFAPYFCAEQNKKWFELAETIPGPTTAVLQKYAKQYKMVIIAPLYEKENESVYYNTAAVINADGAYLGKMRKIHIPQMDSGFLEKFYFQPGDLGFPVFDTAYAKIGVYICYDRHFPECARILALNGAEILFNPSAAADHGLRKLWGIEQVAQATANGVFVGANNRVGIEKPWEIGEFYGSSFFVDPYGKIIAQASSNRAEVLLADLDMSAISAARSSWQFLKDRRPAMYADICSESFLLKNIGGEKA